MGMMEYKLLEIILYRISTKFVGHFMDFIEKTIYDLA
jgi:hypothetical protein